MVVGGDFDLARPQLLHRMVAAVVPKLQLEGLAPEGNSRQLMPQADAENRLPSHKPADRIDRIRARLRVAWTVREKNSVRLQGQHIFRRSLRRDHRHLAALAPQLAQNVL